MYTELRTVSWPANVGMPHTPEWAVWQTYPFPRAVSPVKACHFRKSRRNMNVIVLHSPEEAPSERCTIHAEKEKAAHR